MAWLVCSCRLSPLSQLANSQICGYIRVVTYQHWVSCVCFVFKGHWVEKLLCWRAGCKELQRLKIRHLALQTWVVYTWTEGPEPERRADVKAQQNIKGKLGMNQGIEWIWNKAGLRGVICKIAIYEVAGKQKGYMKKDCNSSHIVLIGGDVVSF